MTKVEFLTWLQTAEVGSKLHFKILDDSDDVDYEESDFELTEDFELMEVIVDGCGGNCM